MTALPRVVLLAGLAAAFPLAAEAVELFNWGVHPKDSGMSFGADGRLAGFFPSGIEVERDHMLKLQS